MAHKENRLRIIPLGGLDEVGKNMTVIEYGDDLVVVDAGIMFPDDDHPGVDLILPDYSYVVKRKDKLRGIIITHGHEDHTGALPYLLKELAAPVPVLGTKLTLGLVQGKLEEHKLKKVKLREVRDGGHVSLGAFGFDFFAVNHSIPDAVGVFIRTPVGNIVHTGDFKLDQTPIDGRLTDYGALAKFGKLGVDLLMSDSTNAETSGMTRSEAEVGVALREIIASAEQRVIVASFSSHIHRLQQVCDAAVEAGRKVVVTGRSMVTNTRIARSLGFLQIDEDDIIDAYDAAGIPPEDVVVLCTGSQGEPLSALARMANGDHKTVQVERGDTVVISASPVPGNEKAVSRVINRLAKAGAIVLHKGNASVHVSGHAASEELKLMLNLVQVAYYDLGMKMLEVARFLIRPFYSAFYPVFSDMAARRRWKGLRRRALQLTAGAFGLGVLVALGMQLFGSWAIVLLFGSEYGATVLPAKILFLSVPLVYVHFILTILANALHLENRSAWLLGASAALNLALNVVVIPRYGIVGAAWYPAAGAAYAAKLRGTKQVAVGFGVRAGAFGSQTAKNSPLVSKKRSSCSTP